MARLRIWAYVVSITAVILCIGLLVAEYMKVVDLSSSTMAKVVTAATALAALGCYLMAASKRKR